MNDDGDPGGLELYPIAIGRYHAAEFEDLAVDGEVGRVLELLAEFGAVPNRWPGRGDVRDAAAVEARLLRWAQPDLARNSMLYWVGHGWSDNVTAALAHAASPAAVRTFGVTAAQLADPIRSRQLFPGDHWTIVVVETCQSARFVRLLSADLDNGTEQAERILLLGVSGASATTLGRFCTALSHSLRATFKAATSIGLNDLGQDLHRQLPGSTVRARELGDAALVRTAPPAASLSGPLDTIRYLEEVLSDLPIEQRRHFIAKAQGAEEGEFSWFFEGRERERAEIVAWLRHSTSGMLIVTGPAGTGKSALLGHILIHSLPDLRDALIRRNLIVALAPADRPLEAVFDLVLQVAGLTVADIVHRIADGAGFGTVPSQRDPDLGLANDVEWLTGRLRDREEPFTLLLDALDESTTPLDLAQTVLPAIADLPGVRVLVGTRASTSETPDHSAADQDLLAALLRGGTVGERRAIVRLTRDPEAIRRYVTHRLTEARDFPFRDLRIHDHQPTDAEIATVARRVADQDREFLFARLIVHELLHVPSLMSPGRAVALSQRLSGSHNDLFRSTLARLAEQNDAFPALIRALSLSRGRGLPIADDIWGLVAAVIAERDGLGGEAISRDTIQALLDPAPAYITVDIDNDQTVYRLAHRALVEHFSVGLGVGSDRSAEPAADEVPVAAALLRAARRNESDRLSPYLGRHLSGHVADAGLWDELATTPQVLDRLDPNALTADIVRTMFGRRPIPAPMAGVMAARFQLLDAAPADRAGLRHLATLLSTGTSLLTEIAAPWGVSAADIPKTAVHLQLPGHTGSVNAVCPVPLPDGRTLVASAGDDGTVRLWDPARAAPVGDPLRVRDGTLETLCAVVRPGQPAMLAAAGQNGRIQRWNAVTGRSLGEPAGGHSGPVWGICEVIGAPLLATVGDDATVRIWDSATGAPVGDPMTGHVGAIWRICCFPGADGNAVLATSGSDGTIRMWDPATATAMGFPMTGHDGRVTGVCAFPGPDGGTLLATTGNDGTVRIWDPATARAVGDPLYGHNGPAYGVCAFTGPDGGTLLATTGSDGTIRIWNPATAGAVGSPMCGHDGIAWSVCSVSDPGSAALLATTGNDGTVRVWDPVASAAVGHHRPPYAPSAFSVCEVPGADGYSWLAVTKQDGTFRIWNPFTGTPMTGRVTGHTGRVWSACLVDRAGAAHLATCGDDGTVRLWEMPGGAPAGPPMTGHRGRVCRICPVPAPDGTPLLATCGDDGTIRIWDTATHAPIGALMTGHTGRVLGICPVPMAGGRTLLASAGEDGLVRMWDPASQTPVGASMVGHVGSVSAVCAVPTPSGSWLATGGQDGTVRLWDPESGAAVGPPRLGHAGRVTNVHVIRLPDSTVLLASAGDDATVRLWEPAGTTAVATVETGHTGPIWDVTSLVTPDGRTLLATAGDDGTTRLWDPQIAKPVGAPFGDGCPAVTAIAWLRDPAAGLSRSLLLTGDGEVRAWVPRHGQSAPAGALDPATATSAVARLRPASGDDLFVIGTAGGGVRGLTAGLAAGAAPPADAGVGPVTAIQPGPGGATIVAVGGGTGGIARIDAATGQVLTASRPAHTGPVTELCRLDTPDGRRLVSAGHDGSIRQWDADSLDEDGPVLRGHRGRVCSVSPVAAGPAHPLLASGGSDGTIRIWDPRSGGQVHMLAGSPSHQVTVVRCVGAQDGSALLVSGSDDGTVKVWHPRTWRLVHTIPLRLPVYACTENDRDTVSIARTGGGTTLTIGTAGGTVMLDLHRRLFPG